MPEEIVEVVQADREAAADLVVPHGRWPGFPSDFRSGRADANTLTQAFARHRLTQPARPEAQPSTLQAERDAIAHCLAVQLRGGIAGIEPDVRIGELTDAELATIADAISTNQNKTADHVE